MVEVEIIANGMVNHVAKAFFNLQVLLPAVVAKFTLQLASAVQAIMFVTVVFFHLVAITLNKARYIKL